MAWRAKRSAGAATEDGGRRGKGGDGRKEGKKAQIAAAPELQAAIVTVQKLSLKNASEMREMSNTVFEFWILPYLSSPVKKGLEAGSEYHVQVRAAGKGHGLGPPHCHIAVAFVEALHETLSADGEDGQFKKVLGELLQMMSSEHGLQLTNEVFRVFRLKETYKQEDTPDSDRKVKVQYSLNLKPDIATTVMLATESDTRPTQVPTLEVGYLQSAFNYALVKQEGIKPVGPGPRTELERQVERQLRSLMRQ